MLRRLSPREVLFNLANEWQQELAREWIAAVNAITSAVILKDLVAEIERGDIERALVLLNINVDRFARFEGAILQAYNAGGAATVGFMPALRHPNGNRVVFSWGVRNTPAEQALREHAAGLVDSLVGEQLTSVRNVLIDGLARGQNPRQTALGLVGRVNRRTGARVGGILGNTPSTVERLDRIYLGLRSGDPEAMKAYLGYALRDKRFDGHVRRALEQSGSVPADAVDRIVTAYSNRALKYRADNLAATETNIALARAQNDAFAQQIDAGKLDMRDLTKTWRRTVSREPRHEHLAIVGVEMPFDQPFTLPDGTQCTGPHDPSLPARHLIGCKCLLEYRINFAAQAFRRDRGEGLV